MEIQLVWLYVRTLLLKAAVLQLQTHFSPLSLPILRCKWHLLWKELSLKIERRSESKHQERKVFTPYHGDLRIANLDYIVLAKKEIILSAGAIDSPKILLLSGIGPKKDLSELNIPLVQDLSGVGKNLQDHYFLPLITTQKPGTHHRTSYVNSPASLEEARKQWIKNQTGPLSDYYLPQMIAYLRSDRVLRSEEFQKLDDAVRNRYEAKTKPNYELLSVSDRVSIFIIADKAHAKTAQPSSRPLLGRPSA